MEVSPLHPRPRSNASCSRSTPINRHSRGGLVLIVSPGEGWTRRMQPSLAVDEASPWCRRAQPAGARDGVDSGSKGLRSKALCDPASLLPKLGSTSRSFSVKIQVGDPQGRSGEAGIERRIRLKLIVCCVPPKELGAKVLLWGAGNPSQPRCFAAMDGTRFSHLADTAVLRPAVCDKVMAISTWCPFVCYHRRSGTNLRRPGRQG